MNKINITQPTLLVDKARSERNINKMLQKVRKNGLEFRPHFKTHESREVGRWYKEAGVKKITVSSVSMAEYFSSEWEDITIAFPVNILEIDKLNRLAASISLNLLVEDIEAVRFLSTNLQYQVGIFLKIDVGYHRTGIDPRNKVKIDSILAEVQGSSQLYFKGFLGHAGHTYKCKTTGEINAVHLASKAIMIRLKEKYKRQFSGLIVSLGDTPGCSIADDFSGIDEIRPGNFVYYDLMQNQLGVCAEQEIAVAVACPIVAIHKERNKIVVYGGGVHLSKERLETEDNKTIYGKVVEMNKNLLGEVIPGMEVISLSQEHGIISVPENRIDSYSIGDILAIYPVHSCMSVNLLKDNVEILNE